MFMFLADNRERRILQLYNINLLWKMKSFDFQKNTTLQISRW